MFISLFLALIGCLATGIQTVLIFLQGEGVCFNDGCAIVDSLTLVDPFYFNLAGFIFFLVTAISLASARKGSELSRRFISLVLLAALAAEGVLFSFQIVISKAFCSYCLIILALIALINLLMGLKQFFKGIVIFSAVLLASLVLDYHGGSIKPQELENGTMARLVSRSGDRQLFLFISSTCEHCKKVIASLGNDLTCTVNFNPIDRLDSLPLAEAEPSSSYNSGVNLVFLKRMEINEVPVMLSRTESTMTLIAGEQAIRDFVDEHCRSSAPPVVPQISPDMTSSYLPAAAPGEDGCTIDETCTDPQTDTSGQPPISIR